MLPFDTSLLSEQPIVPTTSALADDTMIVAPDDKAELDVVTDKAATALMPALNIGIVQISPVHNINMMTDLNESKIDTSMELAKTERKTDEIQHTEQIALRVEHALSGNKSGPVQVVSNTTYDGPVDRLHQYLLDQVIPGEEKNESNNYIDILVLIGTSNRRDSSMGHYRSPYHRYMQIAHLLRQRLEKIAMSMSLFAKQNAVQQDPIVGALFEIVIGYMYTININEDQPESSIDRNVGGSGNAETNFAVATAPPKNGCIVIFVSEECVETSLSCIRSVIKHALQVARKDSSLTGITK